MLKHTREEQSNSTLSLLDERKDLALRCWLILPGRADAGFSQQEAPCSQEPAQRHKHQGARPRCARHTGRERLFAVSKKSSGQFLYTQIPSSAGKGIWQSGLCWSRIKGSASRSRAFQAERNFARGREAAGTARRCGRGNSAGAHRTDNERCPSLSPEGRRNMRDGDSFRLPAAQSSPRAAATQRPQT